MEEKVCLQICTFNRGHLLKNTLKRLTLLSKPTEILIVDDGSNDNTKEIVESFKDKLPIKYIYNHNPGWGIASIPRNIGIKNTDCEIIITIEPELIPINDFISEMIELHKVYSNTVISGGTIYHGGFLSKTSEELIKNPLNILNNTVLVNENRLNNNPINPYGYVKVVGWVASFCALYRKQWLLDVGGLDEEFSTYSWEDTDVLTRLTKIGINQRIDEKLQFVHQWHDKLPPTLSKKANEENEKRFKSKNLDPIDPNNDIIANKGREWGVIKNK